MKRRGSKRKYIVGKPLRIPVTTQVKYRTQILTMYTRMSKEVREKILDEMQRDYATEHFAHISGQTVGMDSDNIGSQLRILINRLKGRWDQLFGQLAMGLSPWMADSLNSASATASTASVSGFPDLKIEGQKLSIDIKKLDKPTLATLRASSARSTNFIKSIPSRHIDTVTNAVFDSIAKGRGMEDLTKFFEKHDTQIHNWVHNTSMDQTRKTYNSLNAGRMRKLGIRKGEWIHSGGSQHPRELHEDFDGETFSLDIGAPIGDDGGNVMPGDDPNCRCTFAPVFETDNADDEEETAE